MDHDLPFVEQLAMPRRFSRAASAMEDDMFVTMIGNRIHVTLSRRNLRQLVAMVDDPDPTNTCLFRRDSRGVSLVVHVEDDEEHYQEPAMCAVN